MEESEWQGRLGDKWAAEWKRTDRSFGGLTDRLLGVASAGSFNRALDVGCGAGELSLALARGHAGAEVHGIDVSPELIRVATERAVRLPNVSFECANAATWSREDWQPELIVSRHGVMFFDDPPGAFGHLARIAADDARLVFSCFRSVEENVWADRIDSFIPKEYRGPKSGPGMPGPFAFADPAHVQRILTEGGWAHIAFEPVDYAFVVGSGANPVDDALSFLLAIGSAARAAAELPDAQKASFIANLRRLVEKHNDGQIVAMKACAWIVTARKG
jgi:SAM-dependent methyltransferase